MNHAEPQIDNLDRNAIKVLRELCKNPRQRATDIARNIRIKPETAAHHIKNLLDKSGIIRAIQPIIDIHAMKCQSMLVTWKLNNSSPQSERRAEQFFKTYPAVINTYKVRDHGRYVTQLIGHDDIELNSIIDDMQTALPGLLEERNAQLIIDWTMPRALPDHIFDTILQTKRPRPTPQRHSKTGVNKN